MSFPKRFLLLSFAVALGVLTTIAIQSLIDARRDAARILTTARLYQLHAAIETYSSVHKEEFAMFGHEDSWAVRILPYYNYESTVDRVQDSNIAPIRFRIHNDPGPPAWSSYVVVRLVSDDTLGATPASPNVTEPWIVFALRNSGRDWRDNAEQDYSELADLIDERTGDGEEVGFLTSTGYVGLVSRSMLLLPDREATLRELAQERLTSFE